MSRYGKNRQTKLFAIKLKSKEEKLWGAKLATNNSEKTNKDIIRILYGEQKSETNDGF
jgi:hypothetical protein